MRGPHVRRCAVSVRTGALAESRLGASRHFEDSVYVRASHGTGAGISLHQNLHRGFAGSAGEIGHVQVDAQGQVCLCGSRGCLNTVVGAPALIEVLRASHSRSGTTLIALSGTAARTGQTSWARTSR